MTLLIQAFDMTFDINCALRIIFLIPKIKMNLLIIQQVLS